MRKIMFAVSMAGLLGVVGFSLATASAATVKKTVPVKKVTVKQQAKKAPQKQKATPQKTIRIVQKPTVFHLTSPVMAQFSVGETLRGEPFTATGITEQVSGGTIVFNSLAPEKTTMSPISIDAKTFKTDSGSRDFMIRKFILKAEDAGNQYIVFSPKKISGLPKKIKDGESVRFAIQGDLKIAGVTKPASFAGSAKFSKTGITGSAATTIKRSDYTLIVPEVPFVASVDDAVKLSISLTAK